MASYVSGGRGLVGDFRCDFGSFFPDMGCRGEVFSGLSLSAIPSRVHLRPLRSSV